MPAWSDRPFVSWSPTPAPLGPGRRRRQIWHVDGVLVGVVVVIIDAAVLYIAGLIVVGPKVLSPSAGPCSSYWTNRAHTTLVGFWSVVIVVAVSVTVAVWRRLHPIAVAATQLVVAAVLIPVTLTAHSHALDFVHRGAVSSPDTAPVRCEP